MKRYLFVLLLIAMVGCNATNNRVASPDGRLVATFNLDDSGTPYYTLSFDGVEVIKPSSLGLTTAECDYTTALSLTAVYIYPSVIIYLMMAAIIAAGETDHTIGQIYFQRYFSGARLCACHSQYHHRYSGHLNELFFHNCAFF